MLKLKSILTETGYKKPLDNPAIQKMVKELKRIRGIVDIELDELNSLQVDCYVVLDMDKVSIPDGYKQRHSRSSMVYVPKGFKPGDDVSKFMQAPYKDIIRVMKKFNGRYRIDEYPDVIHHRNEHGKREPVGLASNYYKLVVTWNWEYK